MRIRIRSSRLDGKAEAALARRARLTLGRHEAAIEHVEIAFTRQESPSVASDECHVTVRLRDGGEVLVSDDGRHPGRALLRAAWRIEQHIALRRLRDRRPNGGSPVSRVS
jgi:hypothetical protein